MKLCFDVIELARLTSTEIERQFPIRPSKAGSRFINSTAIVFILFVESDALSRSSCQANQFRALEHLKQELNSITLWHLPKPHYLHPHPHQIHLFRLLHVVHRQHVRVHGWWNSCSILVLALSQCLPKVL